MIVIKQQDKTYSEIMNPASFLITQLEENYRVIYLLLLVMFIVFVVRDVRGRSPAKPVNVVLMPEATSETKACESNTSTKKKTCAHNSKESCLLIKKAE